MTQGGATPSRDHLLLIEDSEFQSKFYKKLLSDRGYEVSLATSGAAAMEAIKSRRPDLILLDLGLPDVNGFHVCLAVRQDPATHDIPIIILTSKTEVPSLLAGFSDGADDYVGKREDTGTLVARIARLLERTRTYRRISDAERLELLRQATGIVTPGIRGPLRVALRNLEVLESFELSDDRHLRARRYLREYINRILRLLQNIDDVSKLASKMFVARQRVLDVKKALAEAEQLARNPELAGKVSDPAERAGAALPAATPGGG